MIKKFNHLDAVIINWSHSEVQSHLIQNLEEKLEKLPEIVLAVFLAIFW